MKKCVWLVLVLASMLSRAQAADVGVSITVGEPGFYGRIDIGNFPRPRVIYAQPVVIERRVAVPEPIYLHVPPGHWKHWSKHCAKYHACGRRVYFVEDSWYNNVYVPKYRRHRGDQGDRRDYGDRGERRDHDDRGDHGGKGHDRGDHGGKDHDRGHGKGHGKDK